MMVSGVHLSFRTSISEWMEVSFTEMENIRVATALVDRMSWGHDFWFGNVKLSCRVEIKQLSSLELDIEI